MKKIPLYGRKGGRNKCIVGYTLVDDDDFDWLSIFSWNLSPWGYAVSRWRGSGRVIVMHRLVLGLASNDSRMGDHKNRNRLDNRKQNLRIVTKAQNLQNLPSGKESSSRFRGVTFCRYTGQWRAGLRVNGRQKWLGRFETEIEAAEAAREARRKYMEFAVD